MKNNSFLPLKGLKILDFSHRLPGPLAGHILSTLGAEVTKVEDQKFQDSFLIGLFKEMDKECFNSWYQELNKNKKTIRLDFSNEKTKELINNLVNESDGIILGLPEKLKVQFGLTFDILHKKNQALAVIEMGASRDGAQHMHDLNAMAEVGMLSLYLKNINSKVVDPPFLPMSGITFGQKVAMDLLATIYQAKNEKRIIWSTSFLKDATSEIIELFWPKNLRHRTKFLHNGLFPCYNIYKLNDGNFAALAAVEEKLWNNFTRVFNFEMNASDRFNTDQSYFTKISDLFSQYSFNQVEKMISGQETCISLVKI